MLVRCWPHRRREIRLECSSPSHGENRAESPRERQQNQRLSLSLICQCPVCIPSRLSRNCPDLLAAIWPGDIALTLNWLPTTDLLVSDIGDEFCSHALIDQADGSRVRVIEASEDWPVEHVRRSMKEG
jgi:hypothetical protein